MGHHFLNNVYTRLHDFFKWGSPFYFERDPVSRDESGASILYPFDNTVRFVEC